MDWRGQGSNHRPSGGQRVYPQTGRSPSVVRETGERRPDGTKLNSEIFHLGKRYRFLKMRWSGFTRVFIQCPIDICNPNAQSTPSWHSLCPTHALIAAARGTSLWTPMPVCWSVDISTASWCTRTTIDPDIPGKWNPADLNVRLWGLMWSHLNGLHLHHVTSYLSTMIMWNSPKASNLPWRRPPWLKGVGIGFNGYNDQMAKLALSLLDHQ